MFSFATTHTKNPEVAGLLLESEALSSALACCTKAGGHPKKARDLVRKASQCHQMCDVQDYVVKCAMTKILGRVPRALSFITREDVTSARTFIRIAQDWITWVSVGSKPPLPTKIPKVLREDTLHGGAIEEIVLDFWASAVQALLQKDLLEARKFFERASDVGSSYGIEINHSIQWTYAASFFPISY